jgi:hypothetical protein
MKIIFSAPSKVMLLQDLDQIASVIERIKCADPTQPLSEETANFTGIDDAGNAVSIEAEFSFAVPEDFLSIGARIPEPSSI